MSELPPLQKVDTLNVGPNTLAIFVDETGVEHYGDPDYPIFGFGACAILGSQYESVIKKPWRHLKWSKFAGANRPLHASDLRELRPGQIGALNYFMLRPFHRIGVVSDDRSVRPDSMDGHRSMALSLQNGIEKMTRKYELAHVAVIFEHSERGSPLIMRDFNWLNRDFFDKRGHRLTTDWCFQPKSSMEPGLEVADVIAHTVGRQQKRWRSAPGVFQKDFAAIFHKVDKALVEFISVRETKLHDVNAAARST